MRFALLGVGSIGKVRKDAILQTPGCSLTAVVDLNKDLAKEIAGENGHVFDSVEELAKSDACDAVVISTPTNFHAEQAIACMESGKHVIVEKPMASNLEESKKMRDVSKQTGMVLSVGFNNRYYPAIKEVRDAIQSGVIGKLSYIKAFGGHTGLSEFKAPWMYDQKIMGGGTMMDVGIHVLDLTQHLMGGVTSVTGISTNDIWKLGDSEDNAFALLRGHNNVVATYHSSWSEWKGYHFYIEAYGDKGMARAFYAPMTSTIITMDEPGGPRKTVTNRYISAIFREKFKGWQTTAINTFIAVHKDFIELTKGNDRGILATAEDGVHVSEIANGVYHSSKTGEQVKVSKGK